MKTEMLSCGIDMSHLVFYHKKNVYDFIEKWESASNSIVDVCKMVWREYSSYLTFQASPTNPQLMVWTLNIALPFLFNHDPDYHLASILDIEEATNTKLPSYITNPNTWLQIGKKKKSLPRTPQFPLQSHPLHPLQRNPRLTKPPRLAFYNLWKRSYDALEIPNPLVTS
jgi:hypothetical protein